MCLVPSPLVDPLAMSHWPSDAAQILYTQLINFKNLSSLFPKFNSKFEDIGRNVGECLLKITRKRLLVVTKNGKKSTIVQLPDPCGGGGAELCW